MWFLGVCRGAVICLLYVIMEVCFRCFLRSYVATVIWSAILWQRGRNLEGKADDASWCGMLPDIREMRFWCESWLSVRRWSVGIGRFWRLVFRVDTGGEV